MEVLNSFSSNHPDKDSKWFGHSCSISEKCIGCKLLNFLGTFSIFVLFVMTWVIFLKVISWIIERTSSFGMPWLWHRLQPMTFLRPRPDFLPIIWLVPTCDFRKIIVFCWWFLETKLMEVLQILGKVSKIPLWVRKSELGKTVGIATLDMWSNRRSFKNLD
jgi:hypothetical protein